MPNCCDIFVTNLTKTIAAAFLFAALLTAQPKPAAKGKHFAIATLAAPKGDKTELTKKQTTLLKDLGEDMAKKLTAQGMVRVPTLDLQCCTVQFTLVKDGSHKVDQTPNPMKVRVAVLDIDNQPLYSENFESIVQGKEKAASDVVGAVLADPKFLKIIKGN